MHKTIVAIAGVVALGATASAQTDIDTFDTYADSAAMNVVWSGTTGFSVASLMPTGGADGTNQYMEIVDAGFSKGKTAPNIISPPAPGSYKVTFYYMNGQAGNPWPGLEVKVLQNAATIANKLLGSGAAATWTAAETPVVAFDGSPITIQVVGTSSAQVDNYCAIDQIKLVAAAQPLSVTASPADTVRLWGTQLMTANPSGGTAPYTSVTFDVGDDASVEGTDNSAPFEFSWNTLGAVPAGTSATATLRVRVTDTSAGTASWLGTYVIDNRGSGLTAMVTNGDFSGAWTGTAPTQVPDGWAVLSADASYTDWGPADVAEQRAGGGPALKITLGTALPPVQVADERYKMRSLAKTGQFTDLQTTFWGKGGFCRMYYVTSQDSGATWQVGNTAGIADDTNWVYVVGPVVHSTVGVSGTSQLAVATHNYLVGSYFWDSVSFTALDLSSADVNDWRLY